MIERGKAGMSPVHHHYIVLGAGPAGLQMAYFLERAGRDHLVLEAGQHAGTFFQTYPRHRTLISINKVHTGYRDPEVNLRWDWNSLLSDDLGARFAGYSTEYFPPASALLRYLSDYAATLTGVRYSSEVAAVSRDGEVFSLRTVDGGAYSCRVLIVASGLSQPYVPCIEGIEFAEQYRDFPTAAEAFTDQRVLIIGKGNAAFETAERMMATAAMIHLVSRGSVKQAWKTHFPGNLRAVNNNLLETYRLKGQNALLDATVQRIARREDGTYAVGFRYAHADGEYEELVYDRVLCCTGFRFDASVFDESCRPSLTIDDRLPDLGADWQSRSVPGMYFAGSLMQSRDYRQSASAFIHGFRYNIRSLHRILETRQHDVPWPRRTISLTPQDLTRAVIERVNQTSALWQQFGYLCDLIVVDEERGEASHFEELPVDHIPASGLTLGRSYYTITLEYGPEDDGDPFVYARIPRTDAGRAHLSRFLHPVVRQYSGRGLVAEHHIIEDLAAEWRETEHVQPLLAFLSEQLGERPSTHRLRVPT